jgi:hypothetical protein
MPRQPTAELTIARERKPQRDTRPTTTAATTTTTDWSAWENWLRAHLSNHVATLHTALGECLAIERRKFERKADALELKIAQLTGAVDILRGAQAPPPAKFPTAKAWEHDVVFHEHDIVTFCGSTYQAIRDTARVPTTKDWRCLAAGGSGFTIRGTYDSAVEYHCFDVVMTNGSSFVALKDNPGMCPGEEWRLWASCGSRGQRGERGPRGEPGASIVGPCGPFIRDSVIDRTRYTATPIMSDGSIGPTLNLRALFEQFLLETSR